MGSYINPPSGDREAWLVEHGAVTSSPSWRDRPAKSLPVCLVDNGPFTAAAIAYNEGEFDHFNGGDPGDTRPRAWYYVPIDDLRAVSNIAGYLT